MYERDKQIMDVIEERGIITIKDLQEALEKRGIKAQKDALWRRCTSLKKYGILRSFPAPGMNSIGRRCTTTYWGAVDE